VLDELLQALSSITVDRELVMIGSQWVHAITGDVPVEVVMSRECDLLLRCPQPARTSQQHYATPLRRTRRMFSRSRRFLGRAPTRGRGRSRVPHAAMTCRPDDADRAHRSGQSNQYSIS
jgi:hypothetical protein